MAGKISRAAGPTVEGELPHGTREDRSVSEGPLPRVAGTDPDAGAERAAQDAPEIPKDPQTRSGEQSRDDETTIGGRRSETTRPAEPKSDTITQSEPIRDGDSVKVTSDEKPGDTRDSTRGK